jgi:hypothetical protein
MYIEFRVNIVNIVNKRDKIKGFRVDALALTRQHRQQMA